MWYKNSSSKTLVNWANQWLTLPIVEYFRKEAAFFDFCCYLRKMTKVESTVQHEISVDSTCTCLRSVGNGTIIKLTWRKRKHIQVMACSHCTGPGTGQGPGNNGFLYYTMYCTHHAVTGNHCFLLCKSQCPSLSLSGSQAVSMSHKDWMCC